MAEPDNASTTLEAVACPGPKECLAVGRFDTPTFSAPIAETHRYGTWTIQAMPWPANVGGAWMTGIACPAVDDCIAVGNYSYGGNAEVDPNVLPFADEWNGTAWTMLPVSSFRRIRSTALSTASHVRASAVASPSGPRVPEVVAACCIEAWNGSAWSMQPATVSADALDPRLFAVTCASKTLCFAAGYEEGHTQGQQTTLTEGWNGSTWTVQPGGQWVSSSFTGVSCASTMFCMATGGIINAGPGIGPSALEWNGASWSLVATPGPAGNANTLRAVSCFSATACMAVGGSAPNRVEEWNGVSWTMLTTPQVPGSIATDLLNVACPHQAVCTTVGAENPNVAFVQWRTIAVWESQRWVMEMTPNAT